MKHGKLHSVAHNYADSLACGLGFVVGIFGTDVFAEAASNAQGSLTVDFLNGTATGAVPNGQVEAAMPLYRATFPSFCEKHDVDAKEFKRVIVTYTARPVGYDVTIEDRSGCSSTRVYRGVPGKIDYTIDALGRRRPNIKFSQA